MLVIYIFLLHFFFFFSNVWKFKRKQDRRPHLGNAAINVSSEESSNSFVEFARFEKNKGSSSTVTFREEIQLYSFPSFCSNDRYGGGTLTDPSRCRKQKFARP